jgi:hypothetical protein
MIASRFDNGATYCASSKRYDALSALALVARTGRTCSAYHPHLGRIDSPQTQMSVAMVKPAPRKRLDVRRVQRFHRRDHADIWPNVLKRGRRISEDDSAISNQGR